MTIKTKLFRLMLVFVCASIMFISCDDEEQPKTEPVLTTSEVTDIATTSAIGGGEITDDGNSEITVSGLVYSITNTMPTIADSKTEESATTGVFTSMLENLTSGTTYHVRAYATNSVGTGYGNVVNFTTGNAPPEATAVSITGTPKVNVELTASYTYSDSENDAEGNSTFQWYRADDDGGTEEEAIEGATELTYHIKDEDEFKYIRFGVTPVATTGSVSGEEVKSEYAGPIAEGTDVTFTYNGEQVTYGIITSSATGRKWLDRNLGAPNVASSFSDFANYGDLFQWGRGDDGHQLINRAATSAGTTSVNGTIATLSSTDNPGHENFITPSAIPYDWRNPQNDNLWQGVEGVNNPCPSGWRIPTKAEFESENLTELSIGYSQLKMTLGGFRIASSGVITDTGGDGVYWTSTISVLNADPDNFYIADGYSFFATDRRGLGASCRCIKD